ncbi:MAG: biotin--[acetyl-CoA-carboxylase] ligase [Planctomycetota bacterium]|nr:biotin--[acetyl-CoA-carboxylase] ligase [Planctomycetota bacterium]
MPLIRAAPEERKDAAGVGEFTFAKPAWVDEAGSTNDDLKRLLAGAAPPEPGFVLAARRQTRGRGRLGNSWQTIPNRDLAFSFYWAGEISPGKAGSLPMACALGIGDFLAAPGLEITTHCRWPNDVMTERGKIGGILTESRSAGSGIRLVVGIGLNAGSRAGRGEEAGTAASIADFAGSVPGQEDLLAGLLPFLAARIAAWNRGGFAAIRADLEARLWDPGTPVRVRSSAGILAGRIAGLGEEGELLLATRAGTISAASSSALDWGVAGQDDD